MKGVSQYEHRKNETANLVLTAASLNRDETESPALVKKMGRINFSKTSHKTMSDKIKRMLRSEISRM